MTITTIAPIVDINGISVPTYADVLAKITADFQAIYGTSIYLAPDSQDGQYLATLALGITNLNAAIVATYNSFSPATAQGAALDSAIKLNGLTGPTGRALARFSGAPSIVSGTPGTVIHNGSVKDVNGIVWNLSPATITIPGGGSISVFAKCSVAGPIAAAANSMTINTPVAGWTVFTNFAALPGTYQETDASLRIRQANAVAFPSQGMVPSMQASLIANGNTNGITAARIYENPSNSTDSNGIPANNISILAVGGADSDVANAIDIVRPPGTPTYGNTTVTSIAGNIINFNRGTTVTVACNVTVKQVVNHVPITGGALPTPTIAAIQAAIQAQLNATPIGLGAVSYLGLVPAASLTGNVLYGTFVVSALTINKNGGSFSAADVAMAYTDIIAAGAVTVTVA